MHFSNTIMQFSISQLNQKFSTSVKLLSKYIYLSWGRDKNYKLKFLSARQEFPSAKLGCNLAKISIPFSKKIITLGKTTAARHGCTSATQGCNLGKWESLSAWMKEGRKRPTLPCFFPSKEKQTLFRSHIDLGNKALQKQMFCAMQWWQNCNLCIMP